eukprot:m.1454386 g.1454386  ORF g.1454386 m.1454386 type:complete len:772 (-) comp25119_c0_seq15:5619-7934(-)
MNNSTGPYGTLSTFEESNRFGLVADPSVSSKSKTSRRWSLSLLNPFSKRTTKLEKTRRSSHDGSDRVVSPVPLVRVQSRKTVNPLFGRGASVKFASPRESNNGSDDLASTETPKDADQMMPPKPPPRPSLKYKKDGGKGRFGDKTKLRQNSSGDVAEIMEEIAMCSTQQLANPTDTANGDTSDSGNSSTTLNKAKARKAKARRQGTGRWNQGAGGGGGSVHRPSMAIMDPDDARIVSPLRAKSIKLASRALPPAPVAQAPSSEDSGDKSSESSRGRRRAAGKSFKDRRQASDGSAGSSASRETRTRKSFKGGRPTNAHASRATDDNERQHRARQTSSSTVTTSKSRNSCGKQRGSERGNHRSHGGKHRVGACVEEDKRSRRVNRSLKHKHPAPVVERRPNSLALDSLPTEQQVREATRHHHHRSRRSDADAAMWAAQQKNQRAPRARPTTRLQVANSSCGADEFMREREAQVRRRIEQTKRRRDTSSQSSSSTRQESTSGLQPMATDASAAVSVASTRRPKKRQGTGKWNAGGARRESVPDTAARDAAVAMTTDTTPTQRKRQGTGRWQGSKPSGGSAAGTSKVLVARHTGGQESQTEENDVDRVLNATNAQLSRAEERVSTLTRGKRQGTGRWNAGGGRKDRGCPDASTAAARSLGAPPDVASERGAQNQSEMVLAASVQLAEEAWRDLAEYRDCTLDEVAHESQLKVDEGDESQIPSWRQEQLQYKTHDKLVGMTRQQRQRHMKLQKRIAAKQHQIEKLIAGYLPANEC